MARRLLPLIVLLLPLTAGRTSTASAKPRTAAPATSCTGLTLGPGDYERTLKIGGRSRAYSLHVPPAYRPSVAMPLVLSFHGGMGTSAKHERTVQFRPKADKASFLLVTPEGAGRLPHLLQTWNAGNCCGYARANGVDDVAFVRGILDALEREVCVDSRRVYATGFSNGAMLSHRLGCELADRIAAIAPVGGGIGDMDMDARPPRRIFECNPPRAVPVLGIHGREDGCYPFDGGSGSGLSRETKIGIPESMTRWTARNRCENSTHVTYAKGAAECRFWNGCAADTGLCTISNGGHAWPGTPEKTSFGIRACGGGVVPRDLSATDAIWDFFAAHPMPPKPTGIR